MIHQPSGSVGGTLDNVRATMGFHDQLEEHTTRLLSAATGRTPKAIRKATRIDNWFSAGKAVSFGLVDHILCETSPTEHRPS
jgi:ATP-dependent Clp protease protease subunit